MATYEDAIQALRTYLNAATGVPLEQIAVGDSDVVYPGGDFIMVRPFIALHESRHTAEIDANTFAVTVETDWQYQIEFFGPNAPQNACLAASFIWTDVQIAQDLRAADVNVYAWPAAQNVSALWSTMTELRYLTTIGAVISEVLTQTAPGGVECAHVDISIVADGRTLTGTVDAAPK